VTAPGIALQIWSVRDAHDEDPRGVLAAVADLGYRAVEVVLSRRGGLSVAEHRATLDELGLAVCSMHCFLDELEGDLDAVMAAARAWGTDTVVCAWVGPERRRDAEDYRALARTLAAAGTRCRDAGLRLAYHHHDFELAPIDGGRGMDLVWDAVDPSLLAAEVDVYWVSVAGLDPVAYLRRLRERCVLLHAKDRLPDGAPPLAGEGEGLARWNAEVGAGVLDFAAILAAAPHARWVVVEQDFSAGDPLTSARASLEHLTRLLGEGVAS
jgi:sugar phosphate isomerase/epimerase